MVENICCFPLAKVKLCFLLIYQGSSQILWQDGLEAAMTATFFGHLIYASTWKRTITPLMMVSFLGTAAMHAPHSSWLHTPIQKSQSRRRTIQHTKTRVVIEQTYGRWKRHFHVLHSEITMAPEKVCLIIGACGVLHNLPSPCTAFSQSLSVNSFRWRIRGERSGNA